MDKLSITNHQVEWLNLNSLRTSSCVECESSLQEEVGQEMKGTDMLMLS
jgi:hypothetical protein